jgi:hypothetical protein
MTNRLLVAIDPGLSGGIAWKNMANGVVNAQKMPQTKQDLLTALGGFWSDDVLVMMEKVGKHRLGNSAQSSAVFAKHVGHLEMALVAAGLPTVEITATNWMKEIVPGRPKGVDPYAVRARKNYIKDAMQRRYPQLGVTLYTADALGILSYLIANQDKY